MKRISILIITFYQNFISPVLKQLLGANSVCRYSPTCTVYAKICIEKHGFFKGAKMGLIRLLQCQPFNKTYEYI